MDICRRPLGEGANSAVSFTRVHIRPPQPLDDLQPRPPIAEKEVVEQAEGERLHGRHRINPHAAARGNRLRQNEHPSSKLP